MTSSDTLFPGFASRHIDTEDARHFVRLGGVGPCLVLLHGYPGTHAVWHRTAGELGRHFSLVIPDLRGYGQSSCAPSDVEHRAYAKRTMAQDIVDILDNLGIDRAHVMGHGRGGRVAYRLALDHPDRVSRLVVIDILSTLDQMERERSAAPNRAARWAFLAQPAPIPETLIGADPNGWLEGRFRRGTRQGSSDVIDPRAFAEYLRSLSEPDRIHASCEDYRAGTSCDLADDTADLDAGRRIAASTLLVWGRMGSLADIPDSLALWRRWCLDVRGYACECGHYIPEEDPQGLLAGVLPFLRATER